MRVLKVGGGTGRGRNPPYAGWSEGRVCGVHNGDVTNFRGWQYGLPRRCAARNDGFWVFWCGVVGCVFLGLGCFGTGRGRNPPYADWLEGRVCGGGRTGGLVAPGGGVAGDVEEGGADLGVGENLQRGAGGLNKAVGAGQSAGSRIVFGDEGQGVGKIRIGLLAGADGAGPEAALLLGRCGDGQ